MFQNPFEKIKTWFTGQLEEFGEGLFHSYTGSPVNEQIRVLRKARNRKVRKKEEKSASQTYSSDKTRLKTTNKDETH